MVASLAAGCVPATEGDADNDPPEIVYGAVETALLEDDLVAFNVSLTGAPDGEAVEEYARCAAARYALIRGFGFARHVRTRVGESDGTWTADAVYTVSAAIPPGLVRIDAEVMVGNCAERGIPTV